MRPPRLRLRDEPEDRDDRLEDRPEDALERDELDRDMLPELREERLDELLRDEPMPDDRLLREEEMPLRDEPLLRDELLLAELLRDELLREPPRSDPDDDDRDVDPADRLDRDDEPPSSEFREDELRDEVELRVEDPILDDDGRLALLLRDVRPADRVAEDDRLDAERPAVEDDRVDERLLDVELRDPRIDFEPDRFVEELRVLELVVAGREDDLDDRIPEDRFDVDAPRDRELLLIEFPVDDFTRPDREFDVARLVDLLFVAARDPRIVELDFPLVRLAAELRLVDREELLTDEPLRVIETFGFPVVLELAVERDFDVARPFFDELSPRVVTRDDDFPPLAFDFELSTTRDSRAAFAPLSEPVVFDLLPRIVFDLASDSREPF